MFILYVVCVCMYCIYVLCMYVCMYNVCMYVSRFDLIYLILDKPNVDADRQLAKHLVSLYYPKEDRLEIDGK